MGKITAILKSSLLRDSFWMIISQGFSVFIQAAYFLIVARTLGTENYGKFEATRAIFAILFPFVALGMGDILVKNVSRDRNLFSQSWGNALSMLTVSALIFIIVFVPLSHLFLTDTPIVFILLVSVADLIGLRIWQLASGAYIAVHNVGRAALFKIVYSLSKLFFALFLLLSPEFTQDILLIWGTLYCLGSIVPALFFLIAVHREIGKPKFRFSHSDLLQAKDGIFFSISESATIINGLIDRTMLASMSGALAAGIYSAGYRFIDVGYQPINAVVGVTYARFFKHGEKGISGSFKFSKTLMPAAYIYGFLSTVGFVLLAPFVPKILGSDYAESSSILLWLAPIHIISSFQFLAADTLTGAGLQRSRSYIQVAAATLNICLNLYLIPRFSWHGAIWSTLASESFKLFGLWLVVALELRKETALKSY